MRIKNFTVIFNLSCILLINACSNDDHIRATKETPIIGEINPILGCTHEMALNRHPDLNAREDGSCDFSWCSIEERENTNAEFEDIVFEYYQQLKKNNISFNGNINHQYQCGKILGCTNQLAINFIPNAELENGKCDFNYCSTPNYQNTDLALEASINQYIQNVKLSGIEYTGIVNSSYQCGLKLGCMNNLATNYDANAGIENGNCDFSGCGLESYENTNTNFKNQVDNYLANLLANNITHSGTVDLAVNCGAKLGCTSSLAINYVMTAGMDNGSCSFSYCSLNTHENYNGSIDQEVTEYLQKLENLNITHTGTILNQVNCGGLLGCTQSLADNYNNIAQVENVSCTYTLCPFNEDDTQKYDQYTMYKNMYPAASNFINTCPNSIVETFEQEQKGQADILWVIDNSSSMGGEQDHLAENFESFIEKFLQHNININMAITTSDSKVVSDSLVDLTWDKAQADEDKYKEDFKEHIYVGTNGSSSEKIFKGTADFLDSHGQNWIRENSKLVIIMVSDEREQSNISGDELLTQVQSFKPEYNDLMISAIINKDKDNGDRYEDITDNTLGSFLEIEDDFDENLDDLSTSILEQILSYPLQQKAYKNSIKVFVNGVEFEHWTYHKPTHTVKIPPGHAPDIGAEIEIYYTPEI
jgi:hypothetical protein